ETRLLHIAIPSINAEEIESYRRPQNQGVFRTLQLVIPEEIFLAGAGSGLDGTFRDLDHALASSAGITGIK
ncbi:hypothetical protein, partial [Komagataeibacter xylinus]